MRRIIDMNAADTVPTTENVLKAQGIPGGTAVDSRILELAAMSADIYAQTATPAGVLAVIDKDDFSIVYDGSGRNEIDAPLGRIYEEAEHLALFTVTAGAQLSCEISRLFEANELPLAAMLDATASEGTELAADILEDAFRRVLNDNNQPGGVLALMRFSPGYCGWHLSAQKGLFDYLRPEDIGVTVSNSFLMTPLKSISGVIVVGPREIFEFDDNFSFCGECRTRSCRERLIALTSFSEQ